MSYFSIFGGKSTTPGGQTPPGLQASGATDNPTRQGDLGGMRSTQKATDGESDAGGGGGEGSSLPPPLLPPFPSPSGAVASAVAAAAAPV